MVGAEGFELSTYGTQNRRATRLRYAPTGGFLTKAERVEKAYSTLQDQTGETIDGCRISDPVFMPKR